MLTMIAHHPHQKKKTRNTATISKKCSRNRTCSCLYFRQWFICLVRAEVLWKEVCKCSKKGGRNSWKTSKLIDVIHFCGHWWYYWAEKDILCESHNAIHFQHLRCVMYTQTPYRPPGGRQSFCLAWIPLLSPSFSLPLSPLLPPYPLPAPLVPKPDIKKGLLKNNMGNFLPPWELSPRWEESQTSLSLSLSLSLSPTYLPSLSLSILL